MPVDKKKSITTYEGKCLSLIVKANKFAEDHKDGLTETGQKQAEGHIKGLQEQFDRMNKRWEDDFKAKLEEEDEKLHDELDKKVNETQDKVDKMVELLYKLIDKVTVAASASGKMLKLDNSFKPNPGLTVENTLEEFNAWNSSFVAHYDSNKDYLVAATPEIRRQFLNNCIDSKLQAAMITDDTLNMSTPIVGEPDSLLAWLKTHMLRHSPLFIRRYQYSSCKQKPRETFGDWWTRKLIKARDCDLDKVKREDIEVTELICGINDPKLREEILKMKEPKLVDLVALGNQFDTAAKLQENNFNDDIRTNKVQSDYRKSKNDDRQRSHDQDLCQYCGYTPCPPKGKEDCPAKGKVCEGCGGKGHFRKVCRKQNQGPEKTGDSKAAAVRCSSVKVIVDNKEDPADDPTENPDLDRRPGRKTRTENLDRLDGISRLRKATKAENPKTTPSSVPSQRQGGQRSYPQGGKEEVAAILKTWCLIPEAAIVRAQQDLVSDDDVLPDPGGRPKGQNQKNLNLKKQRTFCSSDPERSKRLSKKGCFVY